MVDVISADLVGKIEDIGALRLLRAEWWHEAPLFVLLRFSINGEERRLGVRMDLDKQAILDSVGDEGLDAALCERRQKVWQVVIRERARVMNELQAHSSAA